MMYFLESTPPKVFWAMSPAFRATSTKFTSCLPCFAAAAGVWSGEKVGVPSDKNATSEQIQRQACSDQPSREVIRCSHTRWRPRTGQVAQKSPVLLFYDCEIRANDS